MYKGGVRQSHSAAHQRAQLPKRLAVVEGRRLVSSYRQAGGSEQVGVLLDAAADLIEGRGLATVEERLYRGVMLSPKYWA